jgi:hypothetical protein
MGRLLDALLNQIEAWRYRRNIDWALGLNRRGEVRRDGLTLNVARNHLEIQWRARDVHPWDQDLPLQKRAVVLFEQALTDTDAAISRLFHALPRVDVIDLSVLEPAAEDIILDGTVHRSRFSERQGLSSVRMRLCELGVSYRFPDWYLASLKSEGDELDSRSAVTELFGNIPPEMTRRR